jgi:hypothetical protein
VESLLEVYPVTASLVLRVVLLDDQIALSDPLFHQLGCFLQVRLQQVEVDLVHDLRVVVGQLHIGFLGVLSEEYGERFELEEDALLEDLEVGLGLPEVVHLGHQEVPGSRGDLGLQLLQLRLDLLQGLAVRDVLVLLLTQYQIQLAHLVNVFLVNLV